MAAPALAAGDGATLTVVDAAGTAHEFSTASLLAHPDARTVRTTGGSAYGDKAPAFRAVPMAALLAGMPAEGADILVATALDGFVAQLPAAKVLAADPAGATAYLAVEDPAAPWPALPGKAVGAGPFYVVWMHPERAGIGPEAWPYQTVRLELKESVARRHPEILVAATLPDDDPARRGQALFIDNCFVCHRMNGGGEASIGPDLNLPMNPTEYFRADVLPRYIRDPASVRHWEGQQMTGFPPEALSDGDISDIVAYLAHMAGHKARP